ncbi:MAG: hypothetical protein JXA01_05320 [Dehalococcoidia bacterium]|nr:hypothetical protein [Dehalococcoidia bacterium]
MRLKHFDQLDLVALMLLLHSAILKDMLLPCCFSGRPWLPLLAVLMLCSCIEATVEPVAQLAENITPAKAAQGQWPRINEFTVDSDNITPEDNVTLKWAVADAEVITIDSGVGKVQPVGTMQVSPQKTTKYTLTAVGERGMATAWVTVQVSEKLTLMPDLIITDITYNSGLLYYTIRNTGGLDAGPNDTYLYDQSNMWRDTSWVSSLKPGEEKTQPFTNFNYHGNKITICADGGKAVPEANEGNNCYIPTFGIKFNYDFQQYASRASWRGSAGRPEFGLQGDRSKGLAVRLGSVVAADGETYFNVIRMVPVAESYAWMEGVFGDWQERWQLGGYMLPLELPNNARFSSMIGLSDEASESSSVAFLFGLMEANGDITWWPGVKAVYGGAPQSMDIDLSAYSGRKVMAVLRVEAGAGIEDNYALWIGPRISQ